MRAVEPLRWRAWLELARLSNLATTFTNVLVGTAVVMHEHSVDWIAVGVVAAAIASLYIAGMGLNDLMDAVVDREERPGRPIPSGRISSRAAKILVIVCMAIGLSLLATRGIPAIACGLSLAALVVLYNLTHQRWTGSIILMGLCRGMVYVTAAAACAWPINVQLIVVLAGTMTSYVILLSWIARSETAATLDRRRWLSLVLPPAVMAPALVITPEEWLRPAIMAAAVIAWLFMAARFVLIRPPLTRRAVMAWLAGICLVDAWFLMLLDRPALALLAGARFGLTLAARRFISAT